MSTRQHKKIDRSLNQQELAARAYALAKRGGAVPPSVQAQIDALDLAVSGLDTTVSAQSANISSLTLAISALSGDVTALTADLDLFNTELAALDTNVSGLISDLAALTTRVDTIEGTLVTIADDVSDLSNEVADLAAQIGPSAELFVFANTAFTIGTFTNTSQTVTVDVPVPSAIADVFADPVKICVDLLICFRTGRSSANTYNLATLTQTYTNTGDASPVVIPQSFTHVHFMGTPSQSAHRVLLYFQLTPGQKIGANIRFTMVWATTVVNTFTQQQAVIQGLAYKY